MTAPRMVLRGTTYLVTRRCTQRQFLLKPSSVTTDVFRYVLALAARRHRIHVHVACVLSNHYHLVVTDPHARLPEFQQLLDALVARAVNAHHGRWESFWAPSSYSAVALASPTDILDKAAYVLANPVAAGLVRAGRQWPGLWSAPGDIGAGALRARRPAHFFAKESSLPESILLELTVPPGFASVAEFRERLSEALADQEARAIQRRAGQAFLGVLKVLAQQPMARPKGGEPRRRLKPRVAARDKWKRVEMLGRLVRFLVSYRRALQAWRAGQDAVVFPEGTYLMRVAHGVACAGAG
jgi:REP element-mobilizing transposase RayT